MVFHRIEPFEYDPYGIKPEWFELMRTHKLAIEYKETGKAKVFLHGKWREYKTGDQIPNEHKP